MLYVDNSDLLCSTQMCWRFSPREHVVLESIESIIPEPPLQKFVRQPKVEVQDEDVDEFTQ